MISRVKFILIALVIVLFIGAGVFIFTAYKKAKESSMRSCMLSLERPMLDFLEKNNISANISFNGDWKTLNKEELGVLWGRLAESGKVDCGTIKNISAGRDYWGNGINIWLRRSSNKNIEIKIRSNGLDGEENTEDDINFQSAN